MLKAIKSDRILALLSGILGVFSFIVILAYHNIADTDLWAKLAEGAWIYKTGHLMFKDVFAFTPTLAEHIDHEWGAGFIFFTLLKFLGPIGLMLLKIILGAGTVVLAARAGYISVKNIWAVLIAALFSALLVFNGYVLVVRSHAFTFFLFALILYILESIRKGDNRFAMAAPFVIMVWANIHGGFVAGLGVIGIYALLSIFTDRKKGEIYVILFVAGVIATVINPYGIKLWNYLIPALLHPRPYITEWMPISFLRADNYSLYKIIFLISAVIIFLGIKKTKGKNNLTGLIVLLVTAVLSFKHRRHIPFFGVALGVYMPLYIESLMQQLSSMAKKFKINIEYGQAVLILYGAIAVITAWRVLPETDPNVLAPVGFYPVRETDILMRAKLKGNAVVPLSWGNYVMWRLYPDIRISMDGRYETVYPDSTYALNYSFYSKKGEDWARIVKDFKVDYIFIDPKNTNLTDEDLKALGYFKIWGDGSSMLYCSEKTRDILVKTAGELPEVTIQPLDAKIPGKWPVKNGGKI